MQFFLSGVNIKSFLLRSKCYTIALALLTLDFSHASGCVSPPDCLVTPQGSNTDDYSQTIKTIRESVVNWTSSLISVVGGNVTFSIQTDLQNVDDEQLKLRVVPYVKSASTNWKYCRVNDHVKRLQCSPSTKYGSDLWRSCTLHDVSLLDNGTSVQFWFKSLQTGLAFCQPTTTLLVEGREPPVDILDLEIDPCNGVKPTVSTVAPGVQIICSVYFATDNYTAILPAVFRETCDNSTYIPPSVFTNHTGRYIITTEPMRTIVVGETTSRNLSLGTEGFKFKIKKVDIEVIQGQFQAKITVQFQTCELAKPNQVTIWSSCSNYKQLKDVMNDTFDDYMIYFHFLQFSEKFCTFYIEGSGTEVVPYMSNLGTFHVQEFSIEQVSDVMYVICRLAAGSTANGCLLNVTNYDSNSSTTYNFTRESDTSLIAKGQIPKNEIPMRIRVYDIVNETSGSQAAFDKKITPTVSTFSTPPSGTTGTANTVSSSSSHNSTCMPASSNPFTVSDVEAFQLYKRATICFVVLVVILLAAVVIISIIFIIRTLTTRKKTCSLNEIVKDKEDSSIIGNGTARSNSSPGDEDSTYQFQSVQESEQRIQSGKVELCDGGSVQFNARNDDNREQPREKKSIPGDDITMVEINVMKSQQGKEPSQIEHDKVLISGSDPQVELKKVSLSNSLPSTESQSMVQEKSKDDKSTQVFNRPAQKPQANGSPIVHPFKTQPIANLEHIENGQNVMSKDGSFALSIGMDEVTQPTNNKNEPAVGSQYVSPANDTSTWPSASSTTPMLDDETKP